MAKHPVIVDGLGLEELRSWLVRVLEDNARLMAENAALRVEITRLKGVNGRPKIKPSGMESAAAAAALAALGQRQPPRLGSRSKTPARGTKSGTASARSLPWRRPGSATASGAAKPLPASRSSPRRAKSRLNS
jgi:hypothetical protein